MKLIKTPRLSPHETDDQDVILLGYSMGGLIATDIALLREGVRPKHRILGLVNFDTPFLGIHPHVVSTGFGSLFQKATIPEGNLTNPNLAIGFENVYNDPNFNPLHLPDSVLTSQRDSNGRSPEKGLINGMKRLVQERVEEKKKKEGTCHENSALRGFLGPLKFASGVNNYAALRRRYLHLKELENAEGSPERIRFVNFYTYSSGRSNLTGTV
jgi:hypothetical protein